MALIRANNGGSVAQAATTMASTLGVFQSYGVSQMASTTTARFYLDGVAEAATMDSTITPFGSGATIRVGRRDDGGVQMDGACESLYIWSRILADGEVKQLHVKPYAFLRPKVVRRYFVPSVGLIGALGQVTETDVAQAFTRSKAKAFGQLLETDLAQPFTSRKALAFGQASETSSAQSFSRLKSRTFGLTSESALAQPMRSTKVVVLGLVVEVDQALRMTAVGGAAGGGGIGGAGILRVIRG